MPDIREYVGNAVCFLEYGRVIPALRNLWLSYHPEQATHCKGLGTHTPVSVCCTDIARHPAD